MDAPVETPPIDTSRDAMTRREAVALYYARCRALASQMAELRRLRTLIQTKWGRAPAWPQW